MSYNWKYCSFYPNNFDASALRPRYDDFKIRFHSLFFISRRFFFKGTNLYPLCFRVLIICGRCL